VRSSHIDIGKRGEDAAVRWIESLGWIVHARGERVAGVEIDAIATDPAERALVAIEVKSCCTRRRTPAGCARPEERVGRGKLVRLARAALALEPRARRMGLCVRIDVIAVRLGPSGAGEVRIDHFPNASL
jgi:putative endonuclease